MSETLSDFDIEVPVLIAGGGPVGLTLAMELQAQGVEALLCERNATTTDHPKMDITNGRSMELFRRLGYSEEIRSHAVPETHPFDVVWATNLAGWELARFDYPTVKDMWEIIKSNREGLFAVEPNMRVSQVIVEPTLKNILDRDADLIDVKFGWKFDGFTQDATGVTSTITHQTSGARKKVRSQYLVGCDGGNSRVRKGLGIELEELPVKELLNATGGVVKNLWHAAKLFLRGDRPNDGRVYIIHFKSKDKAKLDKFGVAWHLQMPTRGTLIGQNDIDTYTLHTLLKVGDDPDTIDPATLLRDTLGEDIDAEILVSNHWRPRLALAQSYGRGRVWLAGDSAHQVIPTGGYGMNTGVGDAVALGWKLGAILAGWGHQNLLKAYEAERHPVGFRNREASKRHTAIRMQIAQAETPDIFKDTPKGEISRQRLGQLIRDLGNLENEALGIELGYRYTDSPIICHESGQAPPSNWPDYEPTTWPGGRPPNFWESQTAAVFDRFDPAAFTLLRFAEHDCTAFEDAAKRIGLPLKISDVRHEDIRALYERDLVLIRPDQHVAWRGHTVPDNAAHIIETIRGAA